MPRTHKHPCQCEICWAEDLIYKYPDLLKNFFTAEQVAEVWVAYSEQACAGWLYDDRDTVYKVFKQAPKWFEQGKPEDFYWRTGVEFK